MARQESKPHRAWTRKQAEPKLTADQRAAIAGAVRYTPLGKESIFQHNLITYACAYLNGEIVALRDVLKMCMKFDRPLPHWAVEGLIAIVEADLKRSRGRGPNSSWWKKNEKLKSDTRCYLAVFQARYGSLKGAFPDPFEPSLPSNIVLATWDEAFEKAYKAIFTPGSALTSDSVKKGYKRISKMLKAGGCPYLPADFDLTKEK